MPLGTDRRTQRSASVVEHLVELFLREGFLAFSMADLASRLRCSRTTLYRVADSKEQILVHVLRRFFRDAAEKIEERVIAEPDVANRLRVYLSAVADELEPATPAFYADLLEFAPGREIYATNIRLAAARASAIVDDATAAGAFRAVESGYVGFVVTTVMTAIQQGDSRRRTGLSDGESYRALAELLLHGLDRTR